MPELDEVESQPAVELLRQLLDHQVCYGLFSVLQYNSNKKNISEFCLIIHSFKTWYDNKELFPMKLIDMQVIGAMRPPDGSR